MKIQISVCGHAWPIRLAWGWVPWDLGMSDFLIYLSFVFPLCLCGHPLLQSCEGDGLWPICWHVVAWGAHWKQARFSMHPGVPSAWFPASAWSRQCRLCHSCREFGTPHRSASPPADYPSPWSTLINIDQREWLDLKTTFMPCIPIWCSRWHLQCRVKPPRVACPLPQNRALGVLLVDGRKTGWRHQGSHSVSGP